MANMSYCRFRNTAGDFADCLDALEEQVNDPCAEPLSREEERAARRLYDMCKRYAEAFEDGYGDAFDPDAFDRQD